MRQTVLYYGQPSLTVEVAVAALGLIYLIATAVRGGAGIQVTNAVTPLWRSHLTVWF